MSSLVERLAAAGCVAAAEEADELRAAAAGDAERLARLVARRVSGEPLAWVTGCVRFVGIKVWVHPGVYVPRWQSEALARRAVELVPDEGVAVDLCTGSGAIAVAVGHERPRARVVASEIDPVACRCASGNGVEVYRGHLADPLPRELWGRVDVVTGVVPYVPSEEMGYLPRDVRQHEPRRALDGGPGGLDVLDAAVRASAALLRPGGALLLEVGGDQDVALAGTLGVAGFRPARRLVDTDGDLRGIEATRR